MQHARPALALLFSLAVAAACATSTNEEGEGTPDSGTTPTPVVDSGPKADAGPTKACVATCKNDSECANSCPAVTTGSYCCDLGTNGNVGTNLCFRSASSTCPVPTELPDSGPPPTSY